MRHRSRHSQARRPRTPPRRSPSGGRRAASPQRPAPVLTQAQQFAEFRDSLLAEFQNISRNTASQVETLSRKVNYSVDKPWKNWYNERHDDRAISFLIKCDEVEDELNAKRYESASGMLCGLREAIKEYRLDIRRADGSKVGWAFVDRLRESEQEEKHRKLEAKLVEEREARQARQAAAPASNSNRQSGSNNSGGGSGSGGQNTQQDNNNPICAWCRTRGHLIRVCRVLDRDVKEGRAVKDPNLGRYVRVFNQPPPQINREASQR